MKKLLVLVFAIALCLGVLCLGASAAGYDQNGFGNDGSYEPATQQNGVYQIGNAGQLYWFAQRVNGGEYGANAVLTADITIQTGVLAAIASGRTPTYTWTPICTDYNKAYTGTFDGNDKTISGLYYSGSGNYVGLFGNVGSGGRVQNVNVVDSYISNSIDGGCTGGVCGQNYSGTITNCSFAGSVTGTGSGTYTFVGGVCGNNYSGTITNCNFAGSVTVTGTINSVGGVCGNNYSGTITNCYWLTGKASSGTGTGSGTATEKTEAQFASGEVAWLLNQGQANGPWRQNIGTDDYPVLNSNHGSVIKVTVQNETSTDYYGNGNHVTLPDPSPNKAYFNSSNEYIDPASYSFTDGETVYLKAAVKVTVVYDNGTADTKEQVVDGDSFKLPETPSRSGYYFVGWSDGNTTYKAGAMVENITADTTFTAVWREINIPDPNSITVTQPANGTVKVNPSNGSAGTLITVTATPDEGYELAYITVDGEKITGNTFKMPDKSVTVSAVFVPIEFPFTDVKSGDWFYDYVAYVYSNGLMDGTSATTFEPNANMTRAMVWAILARIDGESVTGAAWATDARAWAMAEGVSDGTDPNGLVTREQFATMLYRYAVAKGYDVSIGESTNILSYADFASISEYAIPAMQWVCGSGIVTGVTDTTLVPQGTATRAQCAAMLMRFTEL